MFYVKWDSENNGVLLSSDVSNKERISPPRPVFHEELNLLGFDKYWNYPESKEPLLWAIGRGYYYRGRLVARAKGGNIFNAPQIVLTEEGINLKLSPIDIDLIVAKNKLHLSKLENEALDFIFNVYKKYKKEGAIFSVAFSGGKDSQVILDLVTRIIPPDELVVIFSDTTMEISYTYESVEETKRLYKNKYPGLKFLIATPPKPAIEFWKEFGPPSRIHRWCCTVAKTAPFYKLIKNITSDSKKKNKIVVFDGVRADESNQRANYDRIAEGVKHFNLVNSRPILKWNKAEIWLYILQRKLIVNNGYRNGLNRVGCSICPFASEWSEYILLEIDSNIYAYVNFLKDFALNLGFKKTEVEKYLVEGFWKKRAGGKYLDKDPKVSIVEAPEKLEISLINAKENFLEWIKVLGNIDYSDKEKNHMYFVYLKNSKSNLIYKFNYIKKKDKNRTSIIFPNFDYNIENYSKIKKVLYKTLYCVHCSGCEIECPMDALKTYPKVSVDLNKCIHCYNCINITEKGCLVAKSIHDYIGGKTMKRRTSGIDKYSSFGLREVWLNSFLEKGTEWIKNNNLGPKQIPAVINWLVEAELLEKNKSINITKTGKLLSVIHKKDKLFVWNIILINLYYNSLIVNWFFNFYKFNEVFTKKNMRDDITSSFPKLNKNTLKNPIDAIINMFDNSPINSKLGIVKIEKKGKTVKNIYKSGSDDIHPFAVAYSLYKAAENIGRKDFTVSELYSSEFNGGPYKIFGISREKLEKILRGLQEDRDRILRVDLNADLDNIFLRADLSSLDIINIYTERINE